MPFNPACLPKTAGASIAALRGALHCSIKGSIDAADKLSFRFLGKADVGVERGSVPRSRIKPMQCPSCGTENPPETDRCRACGKSLALATNTGSADANSRTLTEVPSTGWSKPGAPISSVSQLTPGTELGGRYEILQLLGEGGMGA